jgi:hypothetical protein
VLIAAVGMVEIAPHALHRTVTVGGSSVRPMTWVRWLPHFGQMGGVSGRSTFVLDVSKCTMLSY